MSYAPYYLYVNNITSNYAYFGWTTDTGTVYSAVQLLYSDRSVAQATVWIHTPNDYQEYSTPLNNLSPDTGYIARVCATTDTSGSGQSSWSEYSFTTDAISNPRPSNFYWTHSFSSGENVNISATEWNAFTSKINEFRVYKGLGNASFTTVTSGMDISATIFNQARNAVLGIYSTSVPSVLSGVTDLYASYFNTLANDLNLVT